jgi:hypothetical protein
VTSDVLDVASRQPKARAGGDGEGEEKQNAEGVHERAEDL